MAASDSVATTRSRLQFSIRSLLLLTTAVAVVLGCWQWLRRPTIYSLPPLSDIKRMKVLEFLDVHQTRPGEDFPKEEGGVPRELKPTIDVAQEAWKDIYDALSPSKYDPDHCAWFVLGSMEIQTKHNKRYLLHLFWLQGPDGAFCVGPTKQRMTYRLGGNSAQLMRALEKAYSKAAAQTKPN
jgi:hypothetical protein